MKGITTLICLLFSLGLFAQQGNGIVLHKVGKSKQVYYDQGKTFRVVAQQAVFTAKFYRLTIEDVYFTKGDDTLIVPINEIYMIRANRGLAGDIVGGTIIAAGLASTTYGALSTYTSGVEVFNSVAEGEMNREALNTMQGASLFFSTGVAVRGFGSKIFGTKYVIGKKWAIRLP